MKKYNNFINESISDIFKNNQNNIQSLIDLGIDINKEDEKGKTLLYYAIIFENITSVKILLKQKNIDISMLKTLYFNDEIMDILFDIPNLILTTKQIYDIISLASYPNILKMLKQLDINLLEEYVRLKTKNILLIKYLLNDLEESDTMYKEEILNVLKTKYSDQYNKFKKIQKANKFNL